MVETTINDILATVFQPSHSCPAQFVLSFGSYLSDSDYDILIVSQEILSHEQVKIGLLDCTILPLKLAFLLANRLDLVVATPLLKGKVIYDLPEIRLQLNSALEHPRPPTEIVSHHLAQAMRMRMIADSYYQYQSSGLPTTEINARLASALAWTCTYLLGARHHRFNQTSRPVFLDDLLASPGGDILNSAISLAKLYTIKQNTDINTLLRLASQVDDLFLTTPS